MCYPTDPLLYPSLTKRRKTENITLDTNFNIRLFNTTDTSQVMAINRSCLPENYNQAFYLMLYYRFPKTFIVASASDTVVGYIMCRIETGNSFLRRLRITKKGHIISIAVLSENRQLGIGYALIQEAMKNMTFYKANECYLEVRTTNTKAVNLYQKMGFRISQTVRRYYADGESAHIMVRKLQFNSGFE